MMQAADLPQGEKVNNSGADGLSCEHS